MALGKILLGGAILLGLGKALGSTRPKMTIKWSPTRTDYFVRSYLGSRATGTPLWSNYVTIERGYEGGWNSFVNDDLFVDAESSYKSARDAVERRIRYDIAQKRGWDGLGYREVIRGGRASGRRPKDFSANQLLVGTLVEMEHTDDPVIAREIAMDHLAENRRYYTYLCKFEKEPACRLLTS